MKKYIIKIDKGLNLAPCRHELAAAEIIASFMKSDLLFLRRNLNASPDFLVRKTNQMWELKSPVGNGKRTISNNLRDAAHQSKNVVLDLSRCKMNNRRAISRVRGFLKSGCSTLGRLLVIDKSGNVIDFSDLV